jgi:UDP-glucose 4-epimerase
MGGGQDDYMSKQIQFSYQAPPIGLLAWAADAGGRTSTYKSLRNCSGKVALVCRVNQGNAAQVTFTPLQAQNSSGTGSKAIPSVPIFFNSNTATGDTLTAQTAAASFQRCSVDYQGKTVLITGAGGFLGSHLFRALSKAARIVHCVGRPGRAASTVDLRDETAALQLFELVRPDIVFHLASASGGSVALENVLPHLRDDIVTTANCLVAAHLTGVKRFVIPGSTDEPGPDGVPDSPYSMAKATCVSYGRMFHKIYGTPVVICRVFMTYGPGQKARKIVPYIIRSMLAGESPKLASAARMVDWIYIDDTIRALMLIGVQPNVDGQVFEVGSGECVSIAAFAAHVQRLIPDAPSAIVGDQPSYGGSRRADLTLSKKVLGWEPQVGLEEGITRTIEWYRRSLS